MNVDQVTVAALALPEDDREEIIVRLIAHRSRPPRVRQTWLDEAERRMELVRSGEMRLLDASGVLADPGYEDCRR